MHKQLNDDIIRPPAHSKTPVPVLAPVQINQRYEDRKERRSPGDVVGKISASNLATGATASYFSGRGFRGERVDGKSNYF